ncbi:MAG: hypothetical protein KAH18_06790 [Psychromonas sp.]|nr:hypothetical protein [Psychromonas sp.]
MILYHDNIRHSRKCNIITNGVNPMKNGKTKADVYKKHLISLGVNSKDITEEPKSNNT